MFAPSRYATKFRKARLRPGVIPDWLSLFHFRIHHLEQQPAHSLFQDFLPAQPGRKLLSGYGFLCRLLRDGSAFIVYPE